MKNPIRVLAVDDEKYMLNILKICLSQPNFELTTCSDAISAMSLFKTSKFDIILLDIVMPVIDGFELHSLIRNINPEIPIIMLTARVDDVNGTILNQISQNKNTYYQSKNFKKTELTEKIVKIINEKSANLERAKYLEEIENDVAIAGEAQRAMFPNWDSIEDGVRTCFMYRPYMKITGDIFTKIQLADGKLLVMIGDISGHGIQAAIYMGVINFAVASCVMRKNSSIQPHAVLNYIQDFCANMGLERYMTCIVAILDFKKNKITFQNAGHPDFILFSPERGGIIDPNPNKKGSLPVGLVDKTVYTADDTETIEFKDSDILFAFTDGLTDIQDYDGTTYNINPVNEFLESFSQKGLEAATNFKIIDALFKLGFSGIRDDIALAAISKHEPVANTFEYSIKPMLSEVDKFVQQLAKLTAKMTGDESIAAKIELLCSEFLNNIVVHGLGNKNIPRPIISAKIEFRDEDIMLSFYDKGKNWNMTSNGLEDTASDILNYKRATSGRGLSIIKKITSSITRNRYADILNETIFTVKIK